MRREKCQQDITKTNNNNREKKTIYNKALRVNRIFILNEIIAPGIEIHFHDHQSWLSRIHTTDKRQMVHLQNWNMPDRKERKSIWKERVKNICKMIHVKYKVEDKLQIWLKRGFHRPFSRIRNQQDSQPTKKIRYKINNVSASEPRNNWKILLPIS